jgi:hypothetical protein
MSNVLRIGGLIAGIVLVAIGVGAIYTGVSGRNEVSSDVKREQIVGTPDMTPTLIAAEAKKAGLTNVSLPTCSVANQAVTNGTKAKCFASYMRIHTLEATGGKTYAEMPRYATADGKGTDDATKAVLDPKTKQPADNPVRNLWVTSTALQTALNTSFFAASVGLFAIIMGIALVLAGIGFIVLASGVLTRTANRRQPETQIAGVSAPAAG